MFKSILVPLDRSPFAELALPFAIEIAGRAEASLDLVAIHRSYVYDDPHAANAWALKLDPEKEAEIVDEEQQYLDDAAKRFSDGSGPNITPAVLRGSVIDAESIAERILEHAHVKNTDLIVMTTHARGKVGRFGLGSVADQLIRQSHLPILIVSPGDEGHPRHILPDLNNFLITLDGSELSAKILTSARQLALLMNASITLLRVITPKCSDREQNSIEEYLTQMALRLRDAGLAVQTRVVQSAHAVDAIMNESQIQGSNLLAIATHGYGGFKRLMLGSVADKIIRQSPIPILVHCPVEKKS